MQNPEKRQQTAGIAGSDSGPADPLLPKIVEFRELARCGEEIWISHEGNLYRLRKTKQGKLILTK